MDFYVPPIMVVGAGIILSGVVFVLRVPLSIIAVFAVFLSAYTLYLHINLYAMDYRMLRLGDGLKSVAPTILIAAVIAMSFGYLLMLRKGTQTLPGQNKYSTFNTSSKPSWFASMFRKSMAPPSHSPNFTSSERREYVSALNRLI